MNNLHHLRERINSNISKLKEEISTGSKNSEFYQLLIKGHQSSLKTIDLIERVN